MLDEIKRISAVFKCIFRCFDFAHRVRIPITNGNARRPGHAVTTYTDSPTRVDADLNATSDTHPHANTRTDTNPHCGLDPGRGRGSRNVV